MTPYDETGDDILTASRDTHPALMLTLLFFGGMGLGLYARLILAAIEWARSIEGLAW